jgi:pimeloyl-ACP methyl ester carboxylesterase
MNILLLILLAGGPAAVESKFSQVYPPLAEGMKRSPGQDRAVLLIHGIGIHPINKAKAREPYFHDWQLPASLLVKALGRQADVFSFAYSQTARVEDIPELATLAQAVGKLRFLGYQQIILVGHSTGGVIARLFVEDYPRSGVTRVIQVCAPNDGTSWAKANFLVSRDQEEFLHSLTKKERLMRAEQREDKKIPDNVEFVCVVGAAGPHGDGIVSRSSQWPADLQKQGIPAIRLATTHLTVFRSPAMVDRIAEVVQEDHPRWPREKVQAMRKSIVGQ